MNTNHYGGTRSRHVRAWDRENERRQAEQRRAKLQHEAEERKWTHADERLESPHDPLYDWLEAMTE